MPMEYLTRLSSSTRKRHHCLNSRVVESLHSWVVDVETYKCMSSRYSVVGCWVRSYQCYSDRRIYFDALNRVSGGVLGAVCIALADVRRVGETTLQSGMLCLSMCCCWCWVIVMCVSSDILDWRSFNDKHIAIDVASQRASANSSKATTTTASSSAVTSHSGTAASSDEPSESQLCQQCSLRLTTVLHEIAVYCDAHCSSSCASMTSLLLCDEHVHTSLYDDRCVCCCCDLVCVVKHVLCE